MLPGWMNVWLLLTIDDKEEKGFSFEFPKIEKYVIS